MTLITVLGLASMAFVAWFTYWTWRATGSTRDAIIEAWMNIMVGFAFNWIANLALIPLMTEGAHLSGSNNFWGGWCYTALSMLRQFAIRRWCAVNIQRFSAWLAFQLERVRLN